MRHNFWLLLNFVLLLLAFFKKSQAVESHLEAMDLGKRFAITREIVRQRINMIKERESDFALKML